MRVIIATLLLAGLPAVAAGADQPGRVEKDSMDCRRAMATGTRISSSECHLRSEWKLIDAARRKQYEELNRGLNGGAAAERAPTNSPLPH
jgi:hypothetical protein